MSFLDAFQDYHQIALIPEDQEKTSFIMPEGNYHYTVMSFGLKNARATYQRMVTRMFKELIDKTVEVYIENMVVKMKEKVGQAHDLVNIFYILRQHKLCLNVEKWALWSRIRQVLGIHDHHPWHRCEPRPDNSHPTATPA